jgi:hypothetical protein
MRQVRNWCAWLVLVLAAACGDGSESARGGPSTEVRERLLSLADRAAEQNGSSAARVEVVETTREAANAAIGAGVAGTEAVWAMQIEAKEGEAFRGIRAPGVKGRYIYTVLRQSDYENTDGGLSSEPTDLANLGRVVVLRG